VRSAPLQDKESAVTDQGQWQVVGNAAEVYERAIVPAVFAAWAPFVVDLADPRPGARVLDVACGTGVVARLVARRVGPTGEVVGLDLNAGMLAVAASTASKESATTSRITWQEASATKMPLPDRAFDIVYCQLGLQFFPDRPAALREMFRVLVPGGGLGLMVWRGIEHSPGFATFAEALARHVGAEAAGIMRAPFDLADTEELRSLIAAAGFSDITIRSVAGTVRFPSVVRFVQDQVAGSPLAGHVAKVSDAARAGLVSELETALQSYSATGTLMFPIEANLASARK
jgi:ubiquinone/menaquinone biosynthesis C-methylase UbiE